MRPTPSPTGGGGDPDPRRSEWIDASRGACVVAVVLLHVCLWQYRPWRASVWTPAADGWAWVNGYLAAVRMPLLLTVSGLLAARRVALGWGSPAALVRAGGSAWLYVVWLVVYAAFYAAMPPGPLPHRIEGIGDVARQLVAPETPLWYVFALACYIVVMTSVRQLPTWVVVGSLTVLSIAVQTWWTGDRMTAKVPELAVFFALGVRFAAPVRARVPHLGPVQIGALAVFAAANVLMARLVLPAVPDAALDLLRGLALAAFAVAAVTVAVRWRPLGSLSTSIGRRTLPVYVLHLPLLLLAVVLLGDRPPAALGRAVATPGVAALWPLVMTGLVITASLVVHRAMLTARLGVLFAMPARIGDGLTAVHARLTGPDPLGGALPVAAVVPIAAVAAAPTTVTAATVDSDVPVGVEVPLAPAAPVVP